MMAPTLPQYNPEACGAQCSICPMRLQGAKVIPPQWNQHAYPLAIGGQASASIAWVLPTVFVLDAPDMNAVKFGKFLSGPPGGKFDEMLFNVGMKRNGASAPLLITSALLCRPEVPEMQGRKRYDVKNWMAYWRKGNRQRKKFGHPPEANPFECCKPRLDAELDLAERVAGGLNARLVIQPMGSYALGSVQGQPGKAVSITKYRGSVIEENVR